MALRFITICIIVASSVTSLAQEKQSRSADNRGSAVIEKGLIKVSVMYPFSEGKTFDMAYYETTHMPMVAKLLGSNLVRYTIEKGIASGIPGQPLPYMAIGTFYVKSLEDYRASISPHRDAIRSDFTNYTNVTPVILVSEVIR